MVFGNEPVSQFIAFLQIKDAKALEELCKIVADGLVGILTLGDVDGYVIKIEFAFDFHDVGGGLECHVKEYSQEMHEVRHKSGTIQAKAKYKINFFLLIRA